MCLSVRSNWKRDGWNHPVPRKAEKDIICYKWLERGDDKMLQTPFKMVLVKIGQRMKAKLGIGYSYIVVPSEITVNEGIHGFTSKREAFKNFRTEDVIVECIIPKGAEYIRGTNNDIVATEMKLQRIIMEGGKLKKKRV